METLVRYWVTASGAIFAYCTTKADARSVARRLKKAGHTDIKVQDISQQDEG